MCDRAYFSLAFPKDHMLHEAVALVKAVEELLSRAEMTGECAEVLNFTAHYHGQPITGYDWLDNARDLLETMHEEND